MKFNIKIATGFLAILFHINITAQHKPFKQVVQELDSLLSLHSSIHYSDGMIALKDAGISYKMLLEVYPETQETELYAVKDSIDALTLKDYYVHKISYKFREVMYHPDLKKYDLREMIDGLLISDDKKFYSLSIEENTGGSYHSRVTLYHHTDVPEDNRTAFDSFARDGYYEVYTLKTREGTKYLLIGTVVTCNTCMATYALLTHFKDGKFVNDFETIIDGRMGSEITFDPKKKILYVSYQTSDLIRECSCILGPEQFILPGIADIETDTQDCSCTYKFDGSTFRLTSQKQLWSGKE